MPSMIVGPFAQNLGPAFLTASETSFSYFLKASLKREANFLRSASKDDVFFQALAGFKTVSGTSGKVLGIARLKTSKFSYSALAKLPS